MSLIVSSAATLKPEVRLAEAVAQFERMLSLEQKASFHNLRSQTKNTPPSVDDVMRLTADINQSHKLGSRCYGPRFTKFLHTTQQFAALGDVIIGGSQNLIACGVWSLVRMTLLGLVNHSSYIETFSAILMEAGRAVPQNFNLAAIYPRSQELQAYVLEYFIVVVQLCQRFLRHVQKSAIGKLASSINDSDLKDYQAKLTSWSKAIREEMDILVARTTNEEAIENSRFRNMMTKVSKAAAQQQRIQANQMILDFCTAYDYETSWRQLRKVGNTALHTQSVDYAKWKDEAKSSVLAFEGKLGSGKSVLFANMIDDLTSLTLPSKLGMKDHRTSKEPVPAVVAYFFCRHDVPESLKARTILGSLVRQLIRPFVSSSNIVEIPQASTEMRRLISLLQLVKPDTEKIFVVVDGLDLCDSAEAKLVADELHVMRSFFLMRLCVSCRSGLQGDPSTIPSLFPFPETKVVAMPDNTSEIEAFIESELENCLSNRSLVLGDPALILEIQNALSQGSKGMFLWAHLQIKHICTMRTDAEIREALVDLPRDLSDIYTRILTRHEDSRRDYQRKILDFVLVAKRPLTTEEMREAISVTPGDTTWSAAKLINDIYPVLATCGCLIAVDEEELTIRTIHPSVDQFLFSFETSQAHACASLLSSITTYLNYGVFRTELTRRLPVMDVSSAPTKIIDSTSTVSRSVQSLAITLLKSRKQPKFDAARILRDQMPRYKHGEAAEFHFYNYAKQFAVLHATESPLTERRTWSEFLSLLDRKTITISNSEEIYHLLHITIGQKHIGTVGSLMTGHFVPLDQPHLDWFALFKFAIDVLDEMQLTYFLSCLRQGHPLKNVFDLYIEDVGGGSLMAQLINSHKLRALEFVLASSRFIIRHHHLKMTILARRPEVFRLFMNYLVLREDELEELQTLVETEIASPDSELFFSSFPVRPSTSIELDRSTSRLTLNWSDTDSAIV